MPFITEELWAVTAEQGPKRPQLLALSDWPKLEGLADEKAEAEIGWVIDLVTAIRSIRAEMNITARNPAGARRRIRRDPGARGTVGRVHQAARARLRDFFGAERAAGFGAARRARRGGGVAAQGRDRSCRRARAARPRKCRRPKPTSCASMRSSNNPKFVERAAEEVVEEEKEKREEAVARKAKIAEALERLKGAA